MPTQPLIPPKFRALDASGNPLSGGLLYSYAAGTSTPLATYTTRAGSVANANPVVLDANGEADVWTTAGVSYKLELRNSAGAVQWTVDNYPSPAEGDALTLPDGTVAAPSLSFTNDSNTGLYRAGPDNPRLAVGGADAQAWTTTGTTLPGTLGVTGLATVGGCAATGAAGQPGATCTPGTAATATTAQNAVVLNNGNLAFSTAVNPNSNVALSNTLTPMNLPKCVGHVTSGASPTLNSGFNVSSVGLNGTTAVRVTMATAMANTNYAVLVSVGDAQYGASYNRVSATVFDISVFNTISNVDPVDVSANTIRLSFLVFGAQ